MAVYPRYLQDFEAIATPFVASPVVDQRLRSPLATVHRRMLLILSLVLLVIVPLLVRILPAHEQAATAGLLANAVAPAAQAAAPADAPARPAADPRRRARRTRGRARGTRAGERRRLRLAGPRDGLAGEGSVSGEVTVE